jgi:hypothetical protein
MPLNKYGILEYSEYPCPPHISQIIKILSTQSKEILFLNKLEIACIYFT